MVFIDKLAMNLIAEHEYTISPTDITYTLEFIDGPHAASWVVGVTQNEHLDIAVLCLALQVIKVDAIGRVIIDERTLDQLAVIVLYC